MSTEITSTVTSAEENRAAALRWIDAFNARDDEAEAAARTPDYVAHAPDSIEPMPMDDEGWRAFLAVFLEGFPDLHLDVIGSAADEGTVASTSCSPARTRGRSGGSPRRAGGSASPLWRSTE